MFAGIAIGAAYWVYKTRDADSRSMIEKLTPRDFVYVMLLALTCRMDLMMWLAVVGSFIFPAFLSALTFGRAGVPSS
jgi:hypothetical protein